MIDPSTNSERTVQNRVIKLLCDKNGYEYIGNLKESENTNIREDILRTFLMERQELTSAQASEAIRKLKEVSVNLRKWRFVPIRTRSTAATRPCTTRCATRYRSAKVRAYPISRFGSLTGRIPTTTSSTLLRKSPSVSKRKVRSTAGLMSSST